VYLAVAWVSLGLDFAVNNVTAVWPPTGIALAALLLRGPALWPGILVGSFLANWLTNVPALASAGVGVGDALECLAAFWLLQRIGIRNSLDRPRDVGALLLATIVCAPISATVGTASMLAGGAIVGADAPSRWLTWCFGDAAGVTLVAPVVLTWLCRPRPVRGAAGPAERAALLATLAVVVLVVFGRGFPFLYPVFPVLVWAGLRGGTRTTASASVAIAAASVYFQDRVLPGSVTAGGGIYHLLAFDALAGATASPARRHRRRARGGSR
jgi:integral membrane sensor domain MASE1